MIGQTISHYKIVEKLGEGGMGVVYLAEDAKLERKVAIKLLPHNISKHSDERERLKTEAKAAASLNHSNIATIHSIEETDNHIFIVMEYIDGRELKSRIDNSPIPVDEALRISNQIADGLAAAHKEGVVRRDIKSSNIMITGDGRVKIMDFGLAKVRGAAQVTKLGTTVGTAAYMSPEQARGEEVDQRTDIWSFGVLLCEMLTGSSPFARDYENATIYSILNEEPSFAKELPSELEQIARKMLAKDPAQRYQHIEEILESFRSIDTQKEKDVPRVTKNSIAVLPFENISPEKDADYFADGLAEELIVNLTRIKDLRVIPRTSHACQGFWRVWNLHGHPRYN
jgi:non-specific serine/threonine protein kinase